jgi:hypothetical protein
MEFGGDYGKLALSYLELLLFLQEHFILKNCE